MFHDFYPLWASLTPTLFCILRFSAPMRWCCRLSSRRAVGTHHLCLRGSFRSHKARARVTTKPHAWMSRQEFHGGPYSLHAGEPRRVGSHGDGHTAQHLKGNVFVSNVRLHLAVLLIVSEWRRIVVTGLSEYWVYQNPGTPDPLPGLQEDQKASRTAGLRVACSSGLCLHAN